MGRVLAMGTTKNKENKRGGNPRQEQEKIMNGGAMGTATTKVHKRVDIRRNDTVKVMTGRDIGKEGRVLRVLPDEGRVLVEHVMTVKKHVRPNPQRNIKGGIAEQER